MISQNTVLKPSVIGIHAYFLRAHLRGNPVRKLIAAQINFAAVHARPAKVVDSGVSVVVLTEYDDNSARLIRAAPEAIAATL